MKKDLAYIIIGILAMLSMTALFTAIIFYVIGIIKFVKDTDARYDFLIALICEVLSISMSKLGKLKLKQFEDTEDEDQ